MASKQKEPKGVARKYGLLAAAVVAFVSFFAWSIQPVSFEYVDVDKKIVTFGTASHILPLVRILNVVFHPFRRAMIPLDLETLRAEAIANLGDDAGGEPMEMDFGTWNDWEAFEKFVQVADERTHWLGRFSMKATFVDILTRHLLLSQKLRETPEIANETIQAPIFLSACTRAGATFLYQILADTFDEELVPIYSYEVFGGPIQLPHKPPRKEETELVLSILGALNPPLRTMHEYTKPEDPEEDSGWYINTMRGVVAPFMLPSFWHHLNIYQESSAELNKNFWETILKIKQHEAGRKQRYILKAPEHLFGLPYLSEAFPDAKFVTVSRKEEGMYKSGLAMTHAFQRGFVDPTVEETVAFMDVLICHERKALEIAHGKEYAAQVLPVRFEDGLFTNTFEIVAKFARHADLPWDDAKQAHARTVIADRLAWKKHKGRYRVSDFGLTEDGIQERLATICDNLPDSVQGLEEFYNIKA